MHDLTKLLNRLKLIKLKTTLTLKKHIKRLETLYFFSFFYFCFFKIKSIARKILLFINPNTKRYSIVVNNTYADNDHTKSDEIYFFLKKSSKKHLNHNNIFFIHTNKTVHLKEANAVIEFLSNTSKKRSFPILLKKNNTSPALMNLREHYPLNKNDALIFHDYTRNIQYIFHSKNKLKISDQINTVSVILTTFNDEKYIAQALNSIQKQTYQNLEILVIDDCSDDNTKNIVHDILKNDTRIKYFKMEKNEGTYFCRNYGLNQAKGEFVTFHDSDDISRLDRIELCVQEFNLNKKLDVVYANYVRTNYLGFPLKNWKNSIYRNGLITLFIPLKLIKERIGFFDPIRTSADSEFFDRLFHLKLNIKKIEAVLYFSRTEKNSLTHKGDFKIISKNGKFSSNPLRENYYFQYKYFHLNKKNLYIHPFDTQRNFLCPYKMLAPLHKNHLDNYLPYLKNIDSFEYQNAQVALLVKNCHLDNQSPLSLIQNNLFKPLTYIMTILTDGIFIENIISNFKNQNYKNKYLIILNFTEKHNTNLSKKISKLLASNLFSIFSSDESFKNNFFVLNSEKNIKDYFFGYFHEKDYYAPHFLNEQATFLNLKNNTIVGKHSYLKITKKNLFKLKSKDNFKLISFAKVNQHTLLFKKRKFLSLLEKNLIRLDGRSLYVDIHKDTKIWSSSAANFIENKSSNIDLLKQ